MSTTSIKLIEKILGILYLCGAWQPTLIGIALLFGIGNAFDAIVSLVAYVFLLKKKKINVLGVDEN